MFISSHTFSEQSITRKKYSLWKYPCLLTLNFHDVSYFQQKMSDFYSTMRSTFMIMCMKYMKDRKIRTAVVRTAGHILSAYHKSDICLPFFSVLVINHTQQHASLSKNTHTHTLENTSVTLPLFLPLVFAGFPLIHKKLCSISI